MSGATKWRNNRSKKNHKEKHPARIWRIKREVFMPQLKKLEALGYRWLNKEDAYALIKQEINPSKEQFKEFFDSFWKMANSKKYDVFGGLILKKMENGKHGAYSLEYLLNESLLAGGFWGKDYENWV